MLAPSSSDASNTFVYDESLPSNYELEFPEVDCSVSVIEPEADVSKLWKSAVGAAFNPGFNS